MKRALIATVVTLVLAVPGWSMFIRMSGMPVDRLVANLTRLIETHPEDAHMAYVLGRVHAYAFAFGSRLVPGQGEEDRLPYVYEVVEAEAFGTQVTEERQRLQAEERSGQALDEWERERLTELQDAKVSGPVSPEELSGHLSEGVRWHLRAIALDDSKPEHHLGLAWLLEQGASAAPSLATDPLAASSTPPADVETLQGLRVAQWLERSEAEYLRAFESASAADRALRSQPLVPGGSGEPALRHLVSYEAARAVLRLMVLRPAKEGDPELKQRMQDQMATLFKLPPPQMVTPIIFSLDAAQPLESLLSDQVARFDLDGLGPRDWPWLQPDTSLLVWDPDHTGNITSGLQLFGSVTWWLFFDDGYRALELLDDDGDGWLAGTELTGLALWQDRDGDGVSGPCEVTPIEATSVSALAVTATGIDGRSPSNARGLRLRDGRMLPTYDWVTAPAPEP